MLLVAIFVVSACSQSASTDEDEASPPLSQFESEEQVDDVLEEPSKLSGGDDTAQIASTGVVRLSPTAKCSVMTDLEDAFTESEILDYLDCVVPVVDNWIDLTYASMPHPAAYYYVPEDFAGTDGGCGSYDDTSVHYCPSNRAIYLGHETVWDWYHVLGDASMFLVAAHEVTHHLQHEIGTYEYLASLTNTNNPTPANTVFAENQADCGGGAFMAYMLANALLNEDDVNDLAATVAVIADVERDGRDHGQISERLAAFEMGITSTEQHPLASCNDIIPAVPILTAAED
jgi:hypothetical protein